MTVKEIEKEALHETLHSVNQKLAIISRALVPNTNESIMQQLNDSILKLTDSIERLIAIETVKK